MKQDFNAYTKDDLSVWKTLFDRQVDNLQNKACTEYLDSLEHMKDVMRPDKIARFSQINEWFTDSTGWKIHCVPGLIPVEEFFALLAEKKFCSSTWLRSMGQLDYLRHHRCSSSSDLPYSQY